MEARNRRRFRGRTARAVALAAAAAILVLAAVPAVALDPKKAITQYGHASWQSDSGLPKNGVFSIIQSDDGYLWAATMGGLARFDGARFKAFDKKTVPSMGNFSVTALVQDRRGDIWAASLGGGLLRYREGAFRVFTKRDGLPDDRLSALYLDGHGALWIGTKGGGAVRFADGRFKIYGPDSGLPKGTVKGIVEDGNGVLWVGVEGGGLCRLDGDRFVPLTAKDGLSSLFVASLYRDRRGDLWVGTYGGRLMRVRGGRIRTFTPRDGLTSDFVLCTLEDRDGNLWIGTYGGGLDRLRDGEISAYTARDGLNNDIVTSLAEDSEGDLWVGTLGGLERFSDSQATVYTVREGLADDLAWSTLQDREGALWIATNRGLDRFSDGVFRRYGRADGLPDDLVWSLAEDGDGGLWVGTRGGLSRMKDGRFTTYTTRDGLSNDHVLAIEPGRGGGVWIGTDGGGLNRLKDGRVTVYSTRDGLTNDTVLALHEDPSGTLWVGTRDKACVLRNGRFTRLPFEALCFYRDPHGVLWAGTYGNGIVRWKDGRVAACGTKQGLGDDRIYRIVADGRGNFWLGSDRGVLTVSRDELDACMDGRTTGVHCRIFGRDEGLRSSQCSGGCQPAGCVTKNGQVWFPSMRGVVRIDPANARPNDRPPPVLVEEVTVDGKPIDPKAPADIPPGARTVVIRYTALSFVSPERVRFLCKLEGADERWTPADNQRLAVYRNLPPGRYVFRVKACNNDGVWNEEGASFAFNLRPFFYQTRWFYLLCALLLLTAGPLVFLARVRRLKVRERKLVVMVEKRTAQLAEANARLKAQSIQLEDANERLRGLSYLDGLTGIANRRRFDEVLDAEWRRAYRADLPISLLMIDIDHFKAFNDTYGHHAGDECLRNVAGALSQALSRAGDFLARYGGEEFVAILSGSDLEQAARTAEDLRARVESRAIEHSTSSAGAVVTISVGVACRHPREGGAAPELQASADKALYTAKRDGRNRVRIAGE